MTTIRGVELDVQLSVNNDLERALYFTAGEFRTPTASYQSEPFIIYLDERDYKGCDGITPCTYNVFYNPKQYKVSIVDASTPIDSCVKQGFLIGGFQVKGCDFMFLSPKPCDKVDYVRPFADGFSESFQKTVDCDDCLGDFNIESFDDAYDKTCAVISIPGNGGAFDNYEFNTEYDVL